MDPPPFVDAEEILGCPDEAVRPRRFESDVSRPIDVARRMWFGRLLPTGTLGSLSGTQTITFRLEGGAASMRLYGSGDLRARFESLPEVAKEIVALSEIDSQLAALQDLSSQPASSAFLRELLEIWWDSTNTFHFPWGEMTVTPFDFSMIMGFPFGGEPVVIEFVKGSDEILRDLVGDRLASALHM
ncbi:uncharacterized protein LOC110724967 [Chenopodium quinoa]|uniref:uncharacterized protein LOC110724967 n=1 Tax=Chenopodium quinoa TaxID=63459 RepID=UPI000B76D88A|nr:uncharacterized protein LOC110724967 [Chenopodium quinoa]